MARTALTVQQVTRSGLTPSYGAANVDGHSVGNAGTEVLHVKTGGTGCTVTILIPGKVDGQTVPGKAIVIGTSSERLIGPFPPSIYNQASGEIYVDFSAVTSVTIAALRAS